MSTGKTIKLKNLRVDNPDYVPTPRWCWIAALILAAMVEFKII